MSVHTHACTCTQQSINATQAPDWPGSRRICPFRIHVRTATAATAKGDYWHCHSNHGSASPCFCRLVVYVLVQLCCLCVCVCLLKSPLLLLLLLLRRRRLHIILVRVCIDERGSRSTSGLKKPASLLPPIPSFVAPPLLPPHNWVKKPVLQAHKGSVLGPPQAIFATTTRSPPPGHRLSVLLPPPPLSYPPIDRSPLHEGI